MSGIDQRSSLFHMITQDLAQTSMQQMRCRVITHDGCAHFRIHDPINLVAYPDRSLGHDLVRANSLDGVVAPGHLGYHRIVVVCVKPATVAHLSTSFSVKRRAI